MGQKTPAAHLPLLPWSGWVGGGEGGRRRRRREREGACCLVQHGGNGWGALKEAIRWLLVS